MKFNLFFFCCLLLSGTIAKAKDVPSPRIVRLLDSGWQFFLGDAKGADAKDFDDSGWRTLNLPHDWAFEADYGPAAAQKDRGGYKPGGIGWYRKQFDIPADLAGKRVSVAFDAAYMNSEVWINGKHLGKCPYGYISFSYDLTEHLKDKGNVLAVRCDSSLEPSARWYHGCGIYGHVNLIATEATHVVEDGVFVTTPEVTDSNATVAVVTEVSHQGDGEATLTVETTILDPAGKVVTRTAGDIKLAKGDINAIEQKLSVNQPKRWEPATPHLYKAVTRLSVKGKLVDEVTTRFGIRTIEWKTETGFWLNGRVVKLLGVCDHSEAGPVGAATPDELLRWKIQLLKDMGCNAIRTAHNPQTPVFYDLCDEMGMMVMDEIFDGWSRKADEDYGKQAFDQWWERDLRSWVKRDRNHPSVIIWSLGNETRGKIAKKLVHVCHEMDPTRLTTSGHSGSEEMDVEGINGNSETMKFFNTFKPKKPFVATEAPHTWQTRGFYRTKAWFRDGYPNKKKSPFPCPDLTEEEIFTYDWTSGKRNGKQIFNPSYDIGMVRITARKAWELMRDLPWYSGQFRWTGFDYIGEAGYVHGGWPFRLFMGGCLDLAGFKKDLYYFYQSQWTREPMVHILPHWTHPTMKPGTKIPVWVYSNCDEVELFFNGKSLGKDKPGKKWNEMQCDWMVPWQPGTLLAVGYKNGKKVVQTEQKTAGVPAKLALTHEGDTCPIITVTQTDKDGVMNPYAENRIYYHIDGPARILSLESGNPVNTENNTGTNSRTTFFGLGRAFLQTTDKGDLSVVVGAICGEKQLMTSKTINIDVQTLTLRGAAKNDSFKILYSIDGSTPSTIFKGPFNLSGKATIKADVYRGSTKVFSMSETFGPEQGLRWGVVSESNEKEGQQAEDATFKGAIVEHSIKGYHGNGYLLFPAGKSAEVEWYQENDGEAGKSQLLIRYATDAKDGNTSILVTINGKKTALDLKPGQTWTTAKVPFALQRGANTIRISATAKGLLCIDEIAIP